MNKLLLMLCLISLSINAQEIAITENGKKVMLNNDKTWSYIETKNLESKKIETDCNTYVITVTDKVTGTTGTSSKNILIISKDGGKKGLGIFSMLSSKSIILSIQAVGAGNCVDKNDRANILFRDGSRLELNSDGKFNCEGKFTLYFGGSFGKRKELEQLKEKEIETLRIWTSKSYVEEDFTKEQSVEFMNTLQCLSNQSQ